MHNTPRRILFLMSDTGGGHRAAAQALAEALAHEFPTRYHVSMVDGIARGARFPFNHGAAWYFPLVTYMEPLWRTLFRLTNTPRGATVAIRLLDHFINNWFMRFLHSEPPDLIVSVHPFLTTLPLRLVRQSGLRIPFVTVVTDLFDAHALWFEREVDLFTVPTEGAREVARRFGVAERKLKVLGQPISLKFIGNSRSKAEHRNEFGLDPNLRTILLVGGGEGMGRLYETAWAIDQANLSTQLVVIAGRNVALREKLETTRWKRPVRVCGFVSNMPDWMRASDIIITKAGPGTIMEALACGLPILLSGFVPGQEEGNVLFVEKSGVGLLRQSPSAIVDTLQRWLAPGNDTLACFAERARTLARPQAAIDIAHEIDQVLNKARG